MRHVIQIAGISDRAEAKMLVDAGVDYLGFPLRLHDGREDLSEQDATTIIRSLPAGVAAVCITYLGIAAEVSSLCRALGVRWVQLHGSITVRELETLRNVPAPISIIKSLIVREDNADELEHELELYSPLVDAFITDTFDCATGRTGATGKTHDWNVARRIVERSPRPVVLAGGLGPDNVREAIERVRPAGVDAHTRVERANGFKDPEAVARFVAEARKGFRDCP